MGANKPFTFNNVRLVFPKLIRPGRNYSQTGDEYAVVALIPKTDTAQIERFRAVYNELATAEFGSIPGNLRPFTGQSDKSVLKDGDDKYRFANPDKKAYYTAYQGNMFINLALDVTKGKIEVVDMDQNPVISEDQVPGGSFGHIVAECSSYKSPKFGPQFSVKPRLVQVTDISQPLGDPGMDVDTALGLLPGTAPPAAAPAAPAATDVNDLL